VVRNQDVDFPGRHEDEFWCWSAGASSHGFDAWVKLRRVNCPLSSRQNGEGFG